MEDKIILDLYIQRNERAISETSRKYGAYCGTVADRILNSPEDTEEILNDTWLAAWNDIPPSLPQCLRAYLGRLTRNLAISRYRFFRTRKRYRPMEQMLSELEDCVPAPDRVEDRVEGMELRQVLRDWVDSLGPEDRCLFVRRYWHGVAVKQLARETGLTQNAMAQRLLKLRRGLKARLEREGVYL